MKVITKHIFFFNVIISLLLFNPLAGKEISASGHSLEKVKREILSNGLTTKNLLDYHYFLFNGNANPGEELNFVKSLPANYKRDILTGFIFKKKADFEAEYNSLLKALNNLPEIPVYYEELVFTSKILGKLDDLKKRIKQTGIQKETLLFAQALIEYNKGNFSGATKIFKQLIKSGFQDFRVYYWYSYSLRNLGEYPTALKQLKIAERKIPAPEFLPGILNAEGSLYYLSGKYDEAERLYEQAKKLAGKYFNKIELVKSLINLAIITDDTGNLKKARNLFYEALALAVKINSLELRALVHSELGVSYTFDNRLIDAEKHYNKSLELFSKLRDKNRLAILYANLGNIYTNISNYKFALESFQKGLEFASENKRARILNLKGIADVYSNIANYSKALEYYRRAKDLADEIKEISMKAEIEESFGILELNLGLPKQALKYFARAENIARTLDNGFFIAGLYHKFGVAYSLLDSLSKAEQYFLSANKINKANGDIYNQLTVNLELAEIYLKQNKTGKASRLLKITGKKCREYDLKNLLTKQYLLSAELYKIDGNYKKAEELLKTAEMLAKEIPDYTAQIAANYELGKMFYNLGKLQTAEKYFLKATDILENVSKPLFEKKEIQISFYSNFNDVYNDLAKLYLQSKKDTSAFELIDFQRAHNTSQNLNNIKILSRINDENKLKRLYELDWMISSGVYSGLDSLKKEYARLKNKLIKENPGIEKYLGFKRKRTLSEIQNNLDSTENFVSYFITDYFTQIFHVSKSGFHSIRVDVSRDYIDKLIKGISPFYKTGKQKEEIFFNQDLFSFNAEAANKLYNILVKPVSEKLGKNTKIIFSLPPDMLKIPMEFLVTNYKPQESPYNYDKLEFLVNSYSISYAPSGNTLITLRERSSSLNKTNLLIGNSKIENKNFIYSIRGSLLENKETLRDINLESLEFSGKEIEEINSYLGNTEIFMQDNATEYNFKKFASSSKIIHLSTHSFLYKNQPLIVFSKGGGKEDGLLERGEILQLKLSADMVVLSSCKSGLGEIDKSEGVLGMQKSFIDAGAKSVVVSLWDVNDRYTAILMKYFYKYLNEGFDKSVALKLAKNEFIKNDSPNPYYWAAFVLTGNTSKIHLRSAKLFSIDRVVIIIIFLGLIFFFVNLFRGKNSH